jgi:hypothetical protein
MKVVTAVIRRQNLGRIIWITHGQIEINDSVKGATCPDELVNGLPFRFGGDRIVEGPAKGYQSSSKNHYVMFMGTLDQLIVARDNTGRTGRPVGCEQSQTNVVGPLQDDQILSARLSNNIPVETRTPILANTEIIIHKLVPKNSLIKNGYLWIGTKGRQPLGENVRPTSISVEAGVNPVGNRVPEGNNGARAWKPQLSGLTAASSVRLLPLLFRQSPVDSFLSGQHPIPDSFPPKRRAIPISRLQNLIHFRFPVPAIEIKVPG